MQPSTACTNGYFYPFGNLDRAALPTIGRYTQLVSACYKLLWLKALCDGRFRLSVSYVSIRRYSQLSYGHIYSDCNPCEWLCQGGWLVVSGE